MKQDLKTYWAPDEHSRWDDELRRYGTDDVPGEILHDVLVPARGFLRARVVQPGERIRITNPYGQQVMDVMLYDATNVKNCASPSNTILTNGLHGLPVGTTIFAKNGERLATVVTDTCGVVALDGGYCSDSVNELRYGIEGSPNCKTNLVAAMAEYGMTPDDLEEGCFTVGLDLQTDAEGRVTISPSPTKPGDVFELEAESPLIVSASACPSERAVTNNHNPTPMKVFIYRPTQN